MLHAPTCHFCQSPNAYFSSTTLVSKEAEEAVISELEALMNQLNPPVIKEKKADKKPDEKKEE